MYEMQVSVIVPTYNRAKDLKAALDSIMIQTELPKEVIIVDDSINENVKDACMEITSKLKEKKIDLTYIRNKKERSLTVARNIGIDHCTGDIILFLDDDVILDDNYIKGILKVYEEKPNALGVQGLITNLAVKERGEFINKIFFYFHKEKDECNVLPSTYNTYPYSIDDVIPCQWLAGSNQSYKRQILQKFKFDENLKRYSYKEDLDLSYRIFKNYPNSLYLTPHVKLIHNFSEAGKLPNKNRVYMQHVYTFYFFYKNIDQTLKNKLIFYWSVVGLFFRFSIKYTLSLLLKPSKKKVTRIKYFMGAHIFCVKHLKEIKKRDLEFFNKTLD